MRAIAGGLRTAWSSRLLRVFGGKMNGADRAASRTVIGVVALACVVLAAYLNAFAGVFQFDDYLVIADNPQVASLAAWWQHMPGIRPLLKFTYALIEGSGSGLAGHHVFNIALHAANAGLVYVILRHLLLERVAACLQPRSPMHVDAVAFGSAALFAAHPVASEAVTMISGRSTALMSFFMLLAIFAHLRNRPLLALLAFALALASKESAVILPLVLLLVDRVRQPERPWRVHLRQLLPQILLLAAALVLMGLSARYRQHFQVGLSTRAPFDNLVTQSAALLYLLSRLAVFSGLNADPVLPVFAAWDGFWIMTTLLIGGLAVTAIALWPRAPWSAAAILWFFLLVAPTNSLLARLDLANERQLYLSALGFFALAVAWLDAVLPRRAVFWAVLAVLAGTLVFATQRRNEVYTSEARFWTDVVDKSPGNARAWNNLGLALAGEAWDSEAAAAYERAIALVPNDYKARFNRRRLCLRSAAGCSKKAQASSR
jgi:protein O-mannosyl-transferase